MEKQYLQLYDYGVSCRIIYISNSEEEELKASIGRVSLKRCTFGNLAAEVLKFTKNSGDSKLCVCMCICTYSYGLRAI